MHENPCIIKVESRAGDHVDEKDVEGMRIANIELSDGQPYYVLLDTTQGYAHATTEANKFMASKEYAGNRKAVAIIARSLATKIVSNFFISVNKPFTPTRVFTNETDAVEWLKKMATGL